MNCKTYYAGEDMPQAVQNCFDTFNQLFLHHIPADIECWIAGGAIRNYFENKPLRDIDLYFPHGTDCDNMKKWLLKPDKSAECISEVDGHLKVRMGEVIYDLLGSKFFVQPEDTIRIFDYTICAAAIARDHMVVHEDYFIDLASRSLVPIILDDDPFESLYRIQKYVQYGYTISRDNLRKVLGRYVDQKMLDVLVDSPGTMMDKLGNEKFLGELITSAAFRADQEPDTPKPKPVQRDYYYGS